MQQASDRTPVLVVGAGPTGLVLAAELARRSIPCRIVDKLPGPTNVSKALAIHSRTLELFEQMGIATEFVERGLKMHKLNLYADKHALASIRLDRQDSPYPFILDLAQSETEAILNKRIERFGIRVEREVELQSIVQNEKSVTATLRFSDGHEETIIASWLIGCDGAHSKVRHLLDMAFEGEAYPEGFALADVRLRWSLSDEEAYIFLHTHGLLAVFPLPEGRYRLIVSVPGDGEEKTTFTLEDFQRYVDEQGPEGVTVYDSAWIAAFRISSRMVKHYREGRVFLAGDAAHIHSPAGGQGMNTGIQDAYNLGWKLALVERGYASPSLLDTYEKERHPVAKSVLRMSDLLLRANDLHNPLLQNLRNSLLPLLSQQKGIQHRLVDQVSELSVNYRKSPIVCEQRENVLGSEHFNNGPQPGDRAPEAKPLVCIDGTPTRLFEVLPGTTHTLLLLTGKKVDAKALTRLEGIARSVRKRYADQIEVYIVVAEEKVPSGITVNETMLLDPELAMHKRYGADFACLYLVRPDTYIGFRCQPIEEASLVRYLERIFRVTA